jgi:ribonuclease T1
VRRLPRVPALLLAVAAAVLLSAAPAQARGPRPAREVAAVALSALPPEVRDTLALVRRGGPFPHRRDGVVFENREQRLPPRPRGHYREFTVPTPGARDRGARRLVAGRDGELYYSGDHYRSFRRVVEGS